VVPVSPPAALGLHTSDVRELVVAAVTSRHTRFAEAHEVSGSRYAMGFGSQWLDLLVDVHDELRRRGYRTYRLPPAGYKLPVVNDCLVYVWRVPGSADAPSSFASSPTRVNVFHAPPLDPTLFEPGYTGEPEPGSSADVDGADLERVVRAATDSVMPLVLVMVRSTPRQLQSITWAVAELDEDAGTVNFHGQESIWTPEAVVANPTTDVEPFDSGTPQGPTVEPQEQEGSEPDA